MGKARRSWENFEEAAGFVLGFFADTLGISRIEAKQRIKGTGGAKWEIDAKAVAEDGKGFFLVECKEWKTNTISQELIGGIVFKARKVGARGVILLTTVPLQKGARLVAESESVRVIRFTGDSLEDFLAECAELVVRKLKPEQATVTVEMRGEYRRAIATDNAER